MTSPWLASEWEAWEAEMRVLLDRFPIGKERTLAHMLWRLVADRMHEAKEEEYRMKHRKGGG